MDKPVFDNFTLSKIRLTPNGGVDCHFQVCEIKDEAVAYTKHHIESGVEPSTNLIRPFQSMQSMVGDIFLFNDMVKAIEDADLGATSSQKFAISQRAQANINNISVNEVKITGNNDKMSVNIIAKFNTATGASTLLATPRIKLNDDIFGWESDLQVHIETIIREAYAYLFENKSSDEEPLSRLFNANEEDE